MLSGNKSKHGLSWIESLVATGVAGLLCALLLPLFTGANAQVKQVQCTSTLRNLGIAMILYTGEHANEFPRSWHSAGTHQQPGWAISIAPYLGVSSSSIEQNWTAVFNQFYRSPVHQESNPFIYSYAMNVHFELDPNGDDYIGQPDTWRKNWQIPAPDRTVLLAQGRPVMFGDHLMAHQWSGIHAARAALNHNAHRGRANYLFVDGHVELLPIEAVFSPAHNRNLFHPVLAGRRE